MDKINSNVIDFSPAESPSGLSVGQVYIDLDGTLKRGIFAGQSAASFEAVRQANNERYAASGFVHFGKHAVVSSGITIINEGLWSWESTLNINKLVLGESGSNSEGNSKTPNSILNLSGVIFDVKHINAIEKTQSFIKFPQAPDGKTTYHKTKGEVKVHVDAAAAFIYANQSDNIEVVTDRVDMWGFEAYLEEVTTTNPFVYPNGLIQSQATTMNGITTSASNRPVTYYAVFEGDTGSKGKGLDVTKLSYVQLATILGDHKHNLYYLADGRLVQWRLRQRTIAGAGNGDWYRLAQSSEVGDFWTFSGSHSTIIPQGSNDSSVGLGNVDISGSFFNTGTIVQHSSLLRLTTYTGVGRVGNVDTSTFCVNGNCFFMVCGTVHRLNQGAYHPSFNPTGACKYLPNNHWYSTTQSITSSASCFDPSKAYIVDSGFIATNNSGRPDGRYYDAVYADGQGGVCRDMRYSAYGVDSVDFAEADQRVKNGAYRGFEKAVFTEVVGFTEAYYGSTNQRFLSGVANPESYNLGSTPDIYIVYNTGEVEGPFNKCTVSGSNIILEGYKHSSSVNKGAGNAMIARYLPCSLGGTFLQTDVIGNPTNILSTPQLANGWQGSWIPVIPDGTSKDFSYTRKALTTTVRRTESPNTGVSWASGVPPINGVMNNYTYAFTANMVVIDQYQAFAKQTENVVNAVVYGGAKGLGGVALVRYFDKPDGCLLQESLLGSVNKDNTARITASNLLNTSIGRFGSLEPNSAYAMPHSALMSLGIAPANNSSAMKTLNYNVNLNQQAFIQYAYTELKHNGTNWGDDGKVTIVDNQSTKTDLNGNTVLIGTARLREPLGWLTQSSQPRNASRAGLRISFNQWTKDVKPLEERGGIYGK